MADFKPFGMAVNQRLRGMINHELFDTVVERDELYAHYLASFPAGTNLVYKTRTEHDCTCCAQFIKNLGGVVAIVDGKIQTVWDVKGLESPYQEVADAMAAFVRSKPLDTIYRTTANFASFGAATTKQLIDGHVHVWDHFHGGVAKRHLSVSPGKDRGAYKTTLGVFRRGLEELTVEALNTVIELASPAKDGENKGKCVLYKGEEYLASVKAFLEIKEKYDAVTAAEKELFLFSVGADHFAARFRNTAIGTLVDGLSQGKDLESEVGKYEAMVAPANYKRSKSLITPSMVKSAMDKITALGIQPALTRRLAKISDISVNNVLWVDNAAKSLMSNPLEDMLMQVVAKTRSQASEKIAEGAVDISIADFLVNVLPTATEIEALVVNRHASNFATLTTSEDKDAPGIFKWDNNFAWSYSGNLADSDLRKAVQAKGGRVDGAFRFSHSWNHDKRNASLMDLHVFMPGSNIEPGLHTSPCEYYGNGERIGWNNRKHTRSGGSQDVDYTEAAPEGYVPVENITFPNLAKMPQGKYVCKIHNWRLRSPTHGGFKAEIEFEGQVFEYDYPKPLGNHEWVTVAEVTLKNGKFSIDHKIKPGASTKVIWGINTESFVKVQTILLSPNHWDGKEVGNKHWFFILDGCKTDQPVRGIYNEFLKGELDEHRKVFEVLGDKSKCTPVADQLSGLGFSSTQRNTLTVNVKAARGQRRYNINF